MRPVYLGKPSAAGDDKMFRAWVLEAMAQIENASNDSTAQIAKDFTITNHTATRTLDASTATLADLKNVVCTLIEDMQKGGMKRSR